MNVRMQQGKPAYSHVVTITGPVKMIYIAGQLARDVDGNIVGPGVRAARCADGDVCRPSLAAAHAGYQPPPRADPPVSRSRGIADANRGFLRLPARPRGGRRPLSQHMGSFVQSNVEHYQLDERPLLDGKGLRCLPAHKFEIVRKTGLEGMTEGFMKAAVWGPTASCACSRGAPRRGRGFRACYLVPFRWHSLPVAEKSMRLYAKEVLPVLHSWQTSTAPAVVERAAAE